MPYIRTYRVWSYASDGSESLIARVRSLAEGREIARKHARLRRLPLPRRWSWGMYNVVEMYDIAEMYDPLGRDGRGGCVVIGGVFHGRRLA